MPEPLTSASIHPSAQSPPSKGRSSSVANNISRLDILSSHEIMTVIRRLEGFVRHKTKHQAHPLLDPEDIRQEVLIIAFNKRARLSQLSGDATWRWIRTCAARLILARFRRLASERKMLGWMQDRPYPGPKRTFLSLAPDSSLALGIARLSASRQRILTSFYLDGKPVALIASSLGMSVSAVKQALLKSRRALSRLIPKDS